HHHSMRLHRLPWHHSGSDPATQEIRWIPLQPHAYNALAGPAPERSPLRGHPTHRTAGRLVDIRFPELNAVPPQAYVRYDSAVASDQDPLASVGTVRGLLPDRWPLGSYR